MDENTESLCAVAGGWTVFAMMSGEGVKVVKGRGCAPLGKEPRKWGNSRGSRYDFGNSISFLLSALAYSLVGKMGMARLWPGEVMIILVTCTGVTRRMHFTRPVPEAVW